MTQLIYHNREWLAKTFVNESFKDNYLQNVQQVLAFWLSDQNEYVLQTSGSTGKPKKMTFTKEQFKISARQSVAAFNLQSGDNFLLCLDPKHVAGFMMIIRALEVGANLVLAHPSKNPLEDISESVEINFAALVPYQLAYLLSNEKLTARIKKINTIILGGGVVSEHLENQIINSKINCFHTYGMTETLTHVAIRDVGRGQKDFTALDGVAFSQSKEGALIISCPVCKEAITTNDRVALLDQKSFNWLGRLDNVVNSAGVKIDLSELENQVETIFLKSFGFDRSQYFFYSKPDEKFGEILCLAIEGKGEGEAVKALIEKLLNKYHVPKIINFIDKFDRSSIGKINRLKTIERVK